MRRTVLALAAIVVGLTAALSYRAASSALAEFARVRIVDEATRTLGRQVVVSRLSGDPVRGIVLEGVRIAALPGEPPGAFLETPRILAHYRPLALLQDLSRRRGVIASLAVLELDRPIFVLARNAQGHWNFADLFTGQKGASPAALTARVEVREGSVLLSDARRPGAPFAARFDRVTGTFDFATAPLVLLALDAVHAGGQTPGLLHLSGKSTLGEGTFDLDLSTRGASVAHWGSYLVRLPWLAWRGGTFDGTIHLLASKWGTRVVLDYRGHLMMRDGQVLLLPQRTLLSTINGPLAVDNLGVSTDGLTMAVGTSPLWAQGTIMHHEGVHLDLAIRSPSLDLATLQRLLVPNAGIHLTGRAGGDARIIGPIESPRIDGTVVHGSGRVERRDFTELSAQFHYYGGLLVFEHVVTSTGGGRVEGHLRLDLGRKSFFALAGAWGVDATTLRGLGISIAPALRGRASGFIAAAGAPGAVVAQGRVTVANGSVLGLKFDTLATLFGYDYGRVEVDRLEARQGKSSVHSSGALTAAGELDLVVAAVDVDLQSVGRRFGLQRLFAGTADLVGSLRGPVRGPALSGQLVVRDGRVGPFPFDEARGHIRLTTTGLATPGMALRDGQGRYHAIGALRWDKGGQLDLTVSAANVAAQRLLQIAEVPLNVSGTVSGSIRLSGSLASPQAAGSIQLREGRVEGQRVDRAQAEFRWAESQLHLDRVVAEVNSSRVEARGRITRSGQMAISFAARDFDLEDVTVLHTDFLQVAGRVNLGGSIGGIIASPTVSTTVSSSSLVLNGQRFDRADGSARYQRHRLTLAPLVLEQGQGTFRLNGQLLFRDDPLLDLRITAQNAQLPALLGMTKVRTPFALRGVINGEFTASGSFRSPNASLNFDLADGSLDDHPIRDATINATLADHAVTLQTFSITPAQGELVGAGRIDLRGQSEVEFGGHGVDLNLLRPLFGIQRPLAGTLDFTLQLSGRIADPLVGLSASIEHGAVGSTSFDRFFLQSFYREGQFHIEQALLQQGRHKARLEGTAPFNPTQLRFDQSRPMNLRLALVDADLSLLGLLTDRVERADGPVTGEVLITGTVASPKMEGSVTTRDGVVKLRGFAAPFTSVRAQVTFNEDEVRVGQLTARLGEGTVAVAGTVAVRRFRPDRLSLQLSADAVTFVYPPVFSGTLDGALRLGGTAARPSVSGTLTLSHGDLFVPAIAPTASPGPETADLDPSLDLDIRSGEGLWVNVGALRLQVHGAVHAGGTWRRPRLAGEVVAERGTFSAFNNTFTLLEGRASFAEFRGITPVVDARAETRIQVTRLVPTAPGTERLEPRTERVRVLLHIQGTPDDPNLLREITSDPPLPREEILAALAQQVGVARLLRGDLEGALRAELSRTLFGSVGRAAATAFGLEEFNIEYDFARPVQLRIGKLLISALYLTLTSEFGPSPRYIWSLEYRLSPSTTLSFAVDNRGQSDLLYVITHRF